MSRLLDKPLPDGSYPFKYKSAAATDLRETFERIRKQQEQRKSEVTTLRTRIKAKTA